MALSEEKIKAYTKRIMLSRLRLLCVHPFYGLLLMNVIFSINENTPTAATDSERIYFGKKYLEELSDSELDFIMMHEIMHIVLQHCSRDSGGYDHKNFNIAADIVVNSNILKENNMNLNSITLKNYGTSMHLTPGNKEGYLYTVEQVYEMLQKNPPPKKSAGISIDEHDRWDDNVSSPVQKDMWKKRVVNAANSMKMRDPDNSRGLIPEFAERMLEEMQKPQTDWRTILNEFVQQEVCDYSFSPPDRRFTDSNFFLPDFNETEDIARDILFMIDTSGSMTDKMITAAYYEVKGAIDQFDGKLSGWLGFFDAAIIEPKPFADENEFKVIHPEGGGGTDFDIIFEYVEKNMSDNPPACIIILTDGYAPFPDKKVTNEIPVLWLLNNEQVKPPWGRVTKIVV